MSIRIRIPSRKLNGNNDSHKYREFQEQTAGLRLTDDVMALRLQEECAALTLQYRCHADYGCDPTHGFWLHITDWPLPSESEPGHVWLDRSYTTRLSGSIPNHGIYTGWH